MVALDLIKDLHLLPGFTAEPVTELLIANGLAPAALKLGDQRQGGDCQTCLSAIRLQGWLGVIKEIVEIAELVICAAAEAKSCANIVFLAARTVQKPFYRHMPCILGALQKFYDPSPLQSLVGQHNLHD